MQPHCAFYFFLLVCTNRSNVIFGGLCYSSCRCWPSLSSLSYHILHKRIRSAPSRIRFFLNTRGPIKSNRLIVSVAGREGSARQCNLVPPTAPPPTRPPPLLVQAQAPASSTPTPTQTPAAPSGAGAGAVHEAAAGRPRPDRPAGRGRAMASGAPRGGRGARPMPTSARAVLLSGGCHCSTSAYKHHPRSARIAQT